MVVQTQQWLGKEHASTILIILDSASAVLISPSCHTEGGELHWSWQRKLLAKTQRQEGEL